MAVSEGVESMVASSENHMKLDHVREFLGVYKREKGTLGMIGIINALRYL